MKLQLQRYSVHDVDVMDFILMHGAIWCKDDDVSTLEAENAALHAECDRLLAMFGPQNLMSAEEVTEAGFYWQRDDDNCEWGVNYVSSVGWMTQAGVAERLEIFGQFIGPIKMTGVWG